MQVKAVLVHRAGAESGAMVIGGGQLKARAPRGAAVLSAQMVAVGHIPVRALMLCAPKRILLHRGPCPHMAKHVSMSSRCKPHQGGKGGRAI